MKQILYILFAMLLLNSCASRKNLSNDIVYDENAEKYQRALQRSKDIFFASDSSNTIYYDLGWAGLLLTDAKISEKTIPSVYKSIDNDRFTIELPCWEFDTDEYWAATVVVEHKQLDSALVKAKMQGVDDIYMRAMGDYVDYMSKAQFACICIVKEKKKYIVNATIRIQKSMETAEKP